MFLRVLTLWKKVWKSFLPALEPVHARNLHESRAARGSPR
jgi:hypothetical protein